MTKEQLKAEVNYRLSVSILKNMLNQGLITKGELTIIDTKLIKTYQPILGSL